MGQQTDCVERPVRIEACAAFRADQSDLWPVCDTCGWLEDDHAADERTGAVVTELPRRRVRLLERKAS
jgi:hypothetical protein